MTDEPAPRLIRTFEDAERAARDWMIYFGYDDARLTPPGPDGGVDVRSSRAVAQVKSQTSTVSRPVIQQLFGAAQHEGRDALFFSLGGYTADAQVWATQVGMALFTFDLQGEPVAVNSVARAISTAPQPSTAVVLAAANSPALSRPLAPTRHPAGEVYELAPAVERRGRTRDGASRAENVIWFLCCYPAPLVFGLGWLVCSNVDRLKHLAPRLAMIGRYLIAPRGRSVQRAPLKATRMRWYAIALWVAGVVVAAGVLVAASVVFAITIVGIPLARRCLRGLKVVVEPTEWCPTEMLALPVGR